MAVVIGVIGGSGVSGPEAFGSGRDVRIDTPFGAPSDAIALVPFGDLRVAFLRRHGRGHEIAPHRLNHPANLWALQKAGAEVVIASSSTGSLKPSLRPGTFVVPHDYLSPWSVPTVHADGTAHVTPELDDELRRNLISAARAAKVPTRPRGVYVQALGPRLETKSEIAMFAKFGDVVGMTMASEATIARELGIRYASLCSVDNFAHGVAGAAVTFDAIRETQRKNADRIREILRISLEGLA